MLAAAAVLATGFTVVQGGSASAAVSNVLVRGVGSGRCLTPSPNSATSATIQNCGSQRWSTTDTGRITINGQCLDAKGEATANGTPVITYACTNGANQRWTVGADGTIRGVQSGRCLDVKGEATGAGTAVQLYDCHGRSNQRWELVGGTTPPTTPPPGGGPDLTSFGLLRNYLSAPARAATPATCRATSTRTASPARRSSTTNGSGTSSSTAPTTASPGTGSS